MLKLLNTSSTTTTETFWTHYTTPSYWSLWRQSLTGVLLLLFWRPREFCEQSPWGMSGNDVMCWLPVAVSAGSITPSEPLGDSVIREGSTLLTCGVVEPWYGASLSPRSATLCPWRGNCTRYTTSPSFSNIWHGPTKRLSSLGHLPLFLTGL